MALVFYITGERPFPFLEVITYLMVPCSIMWFFFRFKSLIHLERWVWFQLNFSLSALLFGRVRLSCYNQGTKICYGSENIEVESFLTDQSQCEQSSLSGQPISTGHGNSGSFCPVAPGIVTVVICVVIAGLLLYLSALSAKGRGESPGQVIRSCTHHFYFHWWELGHVGTSACQGGR